MRGVVAAGHPLTAQAGADVLEAGGNAVDAAVAAALMSWVAECALTGPGSGGFMLLHTASGENHLLDFFVAAPGRGLQSLERADLRPVDVQFAEGAVQVFNIGPSSCGVYGSPMGLAEAVARFGSLDLASLAAPAARAAREGVEVSPTQGYLFGILEPILSSTPEAAAVYRPGGRTPQPGEKLALPGLGDLLERLGAEGPGFLYTGEAAAAISDWILERGGVLTREDLAGYEVVERAPARASYRGREILTNPPPSSGGILIAYSLDLLERLGRPGDLRAVVQVMDQANRARTEEFATGLHSEGYLERFMAVEGLSKAAADVGGRLELGESGAADSTAGPNGGRLGSTTHVSVIDGDGACASVTASNGSCSGVLVPGTSVQLNNMLGEQDLNPLGYHRYDPGQRVASMMAPTVVLRDGVAEIALGSAGSNRIRSAILQTILGIVDDGLMAAEAVQRPRLHYEDGIVHAEPGLDEDSLAAMEREGMKVQRWTEQNLYFGGVQAVARDPATGELSGGGDPRRGGAAVVVG